MLWLSMIYLALISLVNIAVGFMAALYLGRGPRCWHDVQRVVEFRVVADLSRWRPVGWRDWLSRRRRAAQRGD